MSEIPNEAHILNGKYDTAAIRNGAVQFVECSHCGAKPGERCVLTGRNASYPWSREQLRGFAHVARRVEYFEWHDVYGPATRSWEYLAPPEGLRPCSHPRRHCEKCGQCDCGALISEHAELPLPEPKKSSDVDDLLG